MLKHVVINVDQATRLELEQMLVWLTAKHRGACIESTRLEIRADQDELLDRWKLAPA